MEKVQLGARIKSDLYRRVRVLAAKQDKNISDLVEEALRDLLQKYSQRSGGK